MQSWRCYFENSVSQDVYAKYAKPPTPAEEPTFADLGTDTQAEETLEATIKGSAVELWSDALGESFWLVADEADAELAREPRGRVYTAAEARCIIQIADPVIVAEVHRWKRDFDAAVSEFRGHR
jgi:hypothetical protein